MSEVTRPIIATALALCAVFVPTAFISGLTGQFYRQFAITIAISTVISAFNSLTLSPALAALLLKGQGESKDILARGMDKILGPFFHRFNRVFQTGSRNYSRGVGSILSHELGAIAVLRAPAGGDVRRLPCRAAGVRTAAGQTISRELRAIASRRDA